MGDQNQNAFRNATKALERKDDKSKKLADDLDKVLKDTDDDGNPKKKEKKPEKKKEDKKEDKKKEKVKKRKEK